jgi:hypothetical protein
MSNRSTTALEQRGRGRAGVLSVCYVRKAMKRSNLAKKIHSYEHEFCDWTLFAGIGLMEPGSCDSVCNPGS